VTGVLDSADVRSTPARLRSMGAAVPALAPDMTVEAAAPAAHPTRTSIAATAAPRRA
jgi:hypothetical protein